MAGAGDAQDRTEAPTPRRLQRAREQGQVPLSREVPALAALGAAALTLIMLASPAAHDAARQLSLFLGEAHRWDFSDGGRAAVLQAGRAGVRLATPFVLAGLVAGVAGTLLQTGGLLHPGAIKLDLSRLDPRAGVKRLFSLDNAVETAKGLAKVTAMGLAAWFVLRGDLAELRAAPVASLTLMPGQMTRLVLRVLLAVLGVQAVIAAADVIWVRLRHARGLRMSREDVREELKESDGDPRIKQRLKQIRLQRSRKRMMSAVPRAAVVITNPTHYAVALAYDRATTTAPRVVAKGVDSVAARIREVASAHRVPVVANPPLARALYRADLDAEIEPEHYQAVAEIIAYVWRLRSPPARQRAPELP